MKKLFLSLTFFFIVLLVGTVRAAQPLILTDIESVDVFRGISGGYDGVCSDATAQPYNTLYVFSGAYIGGTQFLFTDTKATITVYSEDRVEYEDGMELNNQHLVFEVDKCYPFSDEDYLTITYDGGRSLNIYPGADRSPSGLWYVADDGGTYADVGLTIPLGETFNVTLLSLTEEGFGRFNNLLVLETPISSRQVSGSDIFVLHNNFNLTSIEAYYSSPGSNIPPSIRLVKGDETIISCVPTFGFVKGWHGCFVNQTLSKGEYNIVLGGVHNIDFALGSPINTVEGLEVDFSSSDNVFAWRIGGVAEKEQFDLSWLVGGLLGASFGLVATGGNPIGALVGGLSGVFIGGVLI